MVGPFLVECLTHPRNREIAQEVATAHAYRVPLSVLRGARLPGDPWTPRDSALARAAEALERSRCPGCGQPAWLAHDKSSKWRPQITKCQSCNSIEDLKDLPEIKQRVEKHPQAYHFHSEHVE